MKKALLLLLLLCCAGTSAIAQDCEGSTKGIYLHGNNVRAYINNSGTLFMDEEGGAFQVPFRYPLRSTIYLQSIWLAGYGEEGNLKLAAPGYRIRNGVYDYFPGPLDSIGQITEEQCANWDRVWQVQRYQIEAHRADFEDNGVIDNPILEIIGWPGKGNPHFQDLYGYSLPDNPQGLAPFYDTDNDGLYDPMSGDYPMILHSAIVPEQITWGVFNDAGGPHADSTGEPLQVEVQLTCWAFNCIDNFQLNNTIFTSYKLINRGNEGIDSLFMGLWTDFDLGCDKDDHIGSAPSYNTVFTYNDDNIDGINDPRCPEDYGENPPVQAVTSLNQPLSSVMYFYNNGLVDPPAAMYDPDWPNEYYNYLTGKWRDGEPLTQGGIGYQPGGGLPVTSFCFPGDPNDPESWSSYNDPFLPYQQLLLPSIGLGQLLPNDSRQLDFAYSFFREPGADFLGNVTAMYAGIEDLQNWYDHQFSGICAPAACEEDCVWAGDTNADGIANHYDLLPIGLAMGRSGPERASPLNWAPQNGEDWAILPLNGPNHKHIDADGDGQIAIEDFMITELHYQRTHPGYLPSRDQYQEGPEIFFRDATDTPIPLASGQFRAGSIDIQHIPGLYGLAFSMEYDTNYFEVFRPYRGTGFDTIILEYRRYDALNAQVDYARLADSLESTLSEGRLFPYYFWTKSEYLDTLSSNITQIRFKNIKAIRYDGSEIPIGGTAISFIIPEIPVATPVNEAVNEAIHFFPNPTNGRLELRFPGQQIDGVALFTATGQLAWRQRQRFTDSASLNLGQLPEGLYFLQVQQGAQRIVRKVVLR